MNKIKILFYSHFFKPETGAASVRADYFVKALRNAGHEVLIVSPKPNYPIGEIFDGFKKKLIVKNVKENTIYLPILFVSSHSAIGRLFSYLSYFKFSLIYLLFKNYKPDIVISSSPPIFTSLAALIYSKIKRSKFILDIRDIWPDIGVELGILTNKFSILGLSKIEEFLLKNSDKIIVTAEGDKKNVMDKIENSEKCEIIYNGADTEIFKPISAIEKEDIRKKYNIPTDKQVIIYFGSYNHGMNDIEVLGDFLIHKKFMSKNIHFLSIGSGDNLENLIKKIEGKISYTSIFSLPMEEVAELVGASDVSIIPRKDINRDTGGNIPVKCFESWASGIPVLLSNIEDAEISNIFKKCGAGVLVEPNNVEALINGFDDLLSKDLVELGLLGRGFVVENFDRRRESEKLIDIIELIY
ncbi:MAG: glycosyltransferase family 4 protein [Melioribacteraceae bacterium]|nr:glycosyltransferase family 4 protein [Melioribacteraceae bacterium]